MRSKREPEPDDQPNPNFTQIEWIMGKSPQSHRQVQESATKPGLTSPIADQSNKIHILQGRERNLLERMIKRSFLCTTVAVFAALSLAGCDSFSGNEQNQGAANSALSGTSAGGASGPNTPGLGASAALDANNAQSAATIAPAPRQPRARPAAVAEVRNSTTADLNHDGFVTLDEVVAMQAAGLSDDEMLQRLRAANQLYTLTPVQENYLRSQGVSNNVITQMEDINRDQQQETLNTLPPQDDVISQPLPAPPIGAAPPPTAIYPHR